MSERIIVAQGPDGRQILVTLWETGEVEVATRLEAGDVWGPPMEITEDSERVVVRITADATKFLEALESKVLSPDERRRRLLDLLLEREDHGRLYLTNPWFHRAIKRTADLLPDLVAHLALKSRGKAADLLEESHRIARDFQESMDEINRIIALTPEEIERDRERFLRLLESDHDGKETR